MAENKTEIVITARDETTRAFQSVQGGLNGLISTAGKFGLGSLTAGLGAFTSGAAFVGVINSTVKAVAALDDMSEATGASVEKLSALSGVAKVGGHDLDAVAASLQRLGKALHAPDDESKGAAKALQAIGLSVDELKAKDPADAMHDIALAMDQFKDGSGKAAVAMSIFGKAGAQLLPFLKDLAEQQALNGKVTAEQARLAEEYEKNMNRLSGAFSETGKAIARDLIPQLADLSGKLLDGVKSAGGFFGALGIFASTNPFKGVSDNLKTVRADIAEMDRDLKEQQATKAPEDIYFDEGRYKRLLAKKAFLEAQQRREALQESREGENMDANDRKFARKKSLDDFISSQGKTKTGGSVDKTISDYERLTRTIEEQMAVVKLDIETSEKLTDAQKEMARLEADLATGKVKLTDAQKEVIRFRLEDLDAAQKQKQAQADLAEATKKEANELQGLIDATDIGKNLRRAQLEAVAERALQAGKINPEQHRQIIDQLHQVKDEGKAAFDELERAIEGWGKASADAFVEFAFTGKTSFSDMVQSILKDLAKMVVYQNVTKPLADGVSKSISDAGGIGGFFSSLFGSFGGGRASGGPVIPGNYYVVGENGPEVLVPGTAGTVIPNGGMGGGAVVSNVTVNMNGGGAAEGDPGTARELGRRIEAAVRSVIMTEQRPGGMLSGA